MANYFRKIDMEQSLPAPGRDDYIFNLDKFHTIHRNKNQIIATGENNLKVVIAVCRTPAGAEYVLDCIEKGSEISIKHLNIREREQ